DAGRVARVVARLPADPVGSRRGLRGRVPRAGVGVGVAAVPGGPGCTARRARLDALADAQRGRTRGRRGQRGGGAVWPLGGLPREPSRMTTYRLRLWSDELETMRAEARAAIAAGSQWFN